MSKIEKTVFISYRRTNSYHALAIYQALRARGYDVFIDYASIDSGKFDDIILNQIKARAHFIVILTPSALERCDDPNDWVRIEILTALESERNIVPVMFDGFDWKQDVLAKLPDVLRGLARYNGLPVPASLLYFDMAMELIHSKFLDKPVDVVLHLPMPADKEAVARKIAEATNQPAITEKQLSASEYFERANQHYEAKRYEDAIRDLTEAIRLNPQYASAYNNRGVTYSESKKDYDRAINDYNKAIRLNTEYTDAYYSRGLAYYYKNDYDRAIRDYTEAIRLNPQYADAYNNRGLAYEDKKDYDRAIKDYTEAIRLNPQYALAYVNRGNIYYEKGEYTRAINDYNKAIRLNPQLADAYNNRGIVYDEKGEYDRAIHDYTEAIRLNPQYADAYVNRGLTYKNKGEYDLAIADYDRALQIDPTDISAGIYREDALQKKRGS